MSSSAKLENANRITCSWNITRIHTRTPTLKHRYKLMNLASMHKNEVENEAIRLGIRVERNDTIQKTRRLLNSKLEEHIVALRSRLVRLYERQSVDLVLADDDWTSRVRIGGLVRVFLEDGSLETRRWTKGRLLEIYSDETCLVRTRDGSKLREDIVIRSHVKPWHSAMFLKIKMKGAHFLNSSKPQLGVSAVRLSQRQFHPDEGPHSFEDQ